MNVFLQLLNDHKVRYCIVGSFALAYHAKPRYTKDMDIFIEPTEANAERVLQALEELGLEMLNLTVSDFLDKDQIIQIEYEPVRIDLLTDLSGCTFQEVWENRVPANKKAAGRKQDLADLEYLNE